MIGLPLICHTILHLNELNSARYFEQYAVD